MWVVCGLGCNGDEVTRLRGGGGWQVTSGHVGPKLIFETQSPKDSCCLPNYVGNSLSVYYCIMHLGSINCKWYKHHHHHHHHCACYFDVWIYALV